MTQVLSILKNFTPAIVEDGEACGGTGAAAIAAAPVPLFAMQKPTKDKPKKKKKLSMREAVGLQEMNHATVANTAPTVPTSDTDGILAQLKKAEKQNASQEDTDVQTFGITDDGGNIIRVSVRGDDADNFERYLQTKLASNNHQQLDVAELIYDAKDHFEIVDVMWPDVEEDEETDPMLDMPGGEGAGGDQAGEMPTDMPAPDESGAESVLTRVIDMMKADAEARKAEAEARALEAKHKEARAVVQQSTDRIKHEEQLLDMEAWEKARKEQDKEAKQLAKLAKWKHQMKSDSSSDDPFSQGSENEEAANRPTPRKLIPVTTQPKLAKRASIGDVSSFIISRIKP